MYHRARAAERKDDDGVRNSGGVNVTGTYGTSAAVETTRTTSANDYFIYTIIIFIASIIQVI